MRILILSSGNSVRSQMAEGWLRYYAGKSAEVVSAGVYENKGLNALANHLMTVDAVVNIGGQSSDSLEELEDTKFDWLIILHEMPKSAYEKIEADRMIEFYLSDPLALGLEGDERVRAFVDIRNKIDDFCFSFVDENIRSIIPRTD